MKFINGFENLYSITREGKVFSHNKNDFIKGYKTNYHYIDLWKNGKRYKKSIHRLVAETYIDNLENKPEVHHKDNNPFNNNVNNLEWVTRRENLSYVEISPIRNFVECKLYKGEEFIREFNNIAECCRYCSEKLGLSFSSMNKYKKCRDYIIKV